MSNAKKEFIEFIKDKPKVVCAVVERAENWKAVPLATLYEGYTAEEWDSFLETLDGYTYDHGYGSQELYGAIWFEDGTYADRGEYDGSEWWEYHKVPPMPVKHNPTNKVEGDK